MTKLFNINDSDFLKLRISVPMLKCTYNCEYCVSATGQTQTKGGDWTNGMKRPDWGTENGFELSQKAIQWAASLPYRVGVRYDVHGEPFLNEDVIKSIAWLTHQKNVEFVEVQTNASVFKTKIPQITEIADITKLNLYCTFHHSQVSPEQFIENIIFARDSGVSVIANVLVFSDNIFPVGTVLKLCSENKIRTSADIRYPGFTVPPTEDGKRARHFLSVDPFDALLKNGSEGMDAFRTIADSGPLGKELRFLAAMIVGLYGMPGRQCSAGYDYLFVDKLGDVYRCFSYADTNMDKLGSVLDSEFIPKLRDTPYAPCLYKETCHQKEEYGNLKILREVRDLKQKSLNCFCGSDLIVEPQQLFAARMSMIELARHHLNCDRSNLFFPRE